MNNYSNELNFNVVEADMNHKPQFPQSWRPMQYQSTLSHLTVSSLTLMLEPLLVDLIMVKSAETSQF